MWGGHPREREASRDDEGCFSRGRGGIPLEGEGSLGQAWGDLGHAVDRMINKIHMFNVKPQCLNPKH